MVGVVPPVLIGGPAARVVGVVPGVLVGGAEPRVVGVALPVVLGGAETGAGEGVVVAVGNAEVVPGGVGEVTAAPVPLATVVVAAAPETPPGSVTELPVGRTVGVVGRELRRFDGIDGLGPVVAWMTWTGPRPVASCSRSGVVDGLTLGANMRKAPPATAIAAPAPAGPERSGGPSPKPFCASAAAQLVGEFGS